MSLQLEKNTDLAFDTYVLQQCGRKYGDIAIKLRNMAKQLNVALEQLSSSGWTTPAGTAFSKMTEVNWEENIDKYAGLLETLQTILDESAKEYEDLVQNHVNKINL